jgi:Uma2 family endonuclease
MAPVVRSHARKVLGGDACYPSRMASPAQRIPSFEELYRAIEALPPGLTGEILEPGVIRTMGRPGGRHRIGARSILRSLGDDDSWERGREWWLEQEAEIRLLGERLVVPDLGGWRLREGQPVPPPFAFDNPSVERPDWCCEILSDSTSKIDRELKVPLYATACVEWIWLVDPVARQIEIMKTRNGTVDGVETIDGAVKRVIPPFTSIVDTSRWWVDVPDESP